MGENLSYSGMRQNYDKGVLTKENLKSNPIEQFGHWMEEAIRHPDILEPNIMNLATADKHGRPSSRLVLLKDIIEDSPVWYTNYNSRKGHELAENPYAALLFFWEPLERQVRIEGRVEKVSPEISDKYFSSRPVGSRIGAAISPQSEEIELEELEKLFAEAEKEYADKEILRPDYWGGYALIPDRWEFWQGRPNRLHDRFVYTLRDNGWEVHRLGP